MGYELHIMRRFDFEDAEEESSITLSEWLNYVRSDSELELTDGYVVKIPGLTEHFQNKPGFCEWKGHSALDAAYKPWFDFGHGMISTKNPDEETIRKMIKMADAFNAKVLGDDGEIYTVLDYPEPRRKPWWKFW